jgi:hypothetical protein
MKWIIAGLLLLQSCGPSTVVNGTTDLLVYKDVPSGVNCYKLGRYTGISCVQTNTIGK